MSGKKLAFGDADALKRSLIYTFQSGCAVLVCRANQIEEAVAFAQASLSPLRGLLSHRNRAYDAMLHDIVALLAYEDPLVRLFWRPSARMSSLCHGA